MKPFEEALSTFCERGKAWERFQEIGLPSKKDEVFRYVRLRELYEQTFTAPSALTLKSKEIESVIYPECQESLLVFVNGNYCSELSSLPSGMTVLPLSQAKNKFGSFLQARLSKMLREERDPFALLNTTMQAEGAFIYLPPKQEIKAPLQILHWVDAPHAALAPSIYLFLGKEASLKVVSNLVHSGGNAWFNGLIDCTLEERAHLEWNTLALSTKEMWHFEALRASLKKESRLQSVVVTRGSQATRHDYRILLNGEGSEASLFGIGHLDEGRRAHINVLMEHVAPECRSLQHFKHVLGGVSRTSFEGKIYVHKEAQKTEAYQMNNTLLLSEHAQANSKPNLEIFADDVKASHGATVGQLDSEHLFYLKSRGLDPLIARDLLVQGFVREIGDRLSLPSIREEAYGVCS